MERKHKVSLTTILVFAILHIIFGILVIIFAHDSFEKSHIYIIYLKSHSSWTSQQKVDSSKKTQYPMSDLY